MGIRNRLYEFLADESGATAVEYALLAGIIVIGIIGGVTSLGGTIGTSYNDTAAAYPS